ncbi:MAG: uncharacterized protein QOG87_2367 [Actinomycetota bacterium]|jgi:uncharacterized membrane protein YfcA
MDPGPLRDALTLAAGVVTGVLSAAFGVGGAVISTPAIRALGAPAALAVGTTLPSILPSAITGTLRYSREGLIEWRVVRWTAPVGVMAAVGGSLLSKVVPGDGHWLMVLTAALLGFTAYRMARQADEPPLVAAEPDEIAAGHPRRDDRNDGPGVLVAVGAVAGLLSGLLGVGGGIVMVPGFTEVARIPLKTAIATSLACVGIFAIPGTVTHAALGDIDWRFAFWLAVGVVPGARLGAAAAIRATNRRLRLAVAIFLGVVSVLYAGGELISLAR